MVIVCPKCLSYRVILYMGGIGGKIYKCLDYGYIGGIILDVDEKDLPKLLMLRKRSLSDRSNSLKG